ncbi:MAG: hypothetical protein HRT47_04540 [Candidatus Caenarcaniphilales bacterium]|nr:hypothetical protein [Candidatus Caenarcaniphilales bacterium]
MTIISTQFNQVTNATVNAVNSQAKALNKSLEKLSTGKRINRAGDDIASLSISEKLSSELRGITKAKQNITDQIGHLEVLDSAFYQVGDNLQAIRELFVQGLNGTNDTEEIDAIQREINARVKTLQDISDFTKVVNGSNEYIAFGGEGATAYQNYVQIGTNDSEGININYDIGNTTSSPDGVSTNPGWGNFRSSINAFVVSGTSLLNLRLPGASVGSYYSESTGNAEQAQDFDSDGLANLDLMIGNMGRMQSVYAADQEYLQEMYSSLEGKEISLNKSLSHFQDTDFALETANFTKTQIKQQSAGAMLTQANAQAQFVLNLLP